jgi:peptide/nickel transport system permease protein
MGFLPRVLMGVMGAAALLAVLPMFVAADPTVLNLEHLLAAPSTTHWLGTDELGRDLLSRLLYGMQVSLMVGFIVVAVSGTVGTLIGLVSGYFGGWVDTLLMRITDVFLSFPGILIAIAFAALAGPGVENVILALCLMGWVGFARLARAQTLSLRHEDYIRAAEISGVPVARILFGYLLPNVSAPLIVEASFSVAGAMMAEAGLSFLGIGIQPPWPSLGSMLREGARYMLVAPHVVLVPGLALMGLVLAMNLLGDRLRDKLDARHSR